MDANTSPDITNDFIYSQDVSDTSETSHGTGKSLTIKNLLKAGKITVDGTNVGINSTSPTQRLDVVGTVKATAFIGDGSALTGISGGGASVSDSVYGVGWDGDTTVAPSKNAVYDKIETISSGSVGIGTENTITFWPTTTTLGSLPTATYPSLTELSYVKGATSSLQTQINSLSGSSGGWTDGGTSIYNTTTTDKVGIGSTSPTELLDVNGNIKASGYLKTTGTGDSYINATSGNVGVGTFSIGSSGLFVKTNLAIGSNYHTLAAPTNGVLIQGNLGVGTFSPSVSLHVVGNQRVTGLVSCDTIDTDSSGNLTCGTDSGGAGGWTDGGTNIYNTATSDNVAIGTTTPTQKLTVVGTVSATAFTGDGSALTGISAGGWTDGGTNVYPATTTDQVAIGTTTPVSGAILTVNGTIAGGGTGPMAITSANVGIGTTTAGSLLTVGSTGQATVTSAGAISTSSTVSVADDAYAAGWNGSTAVPTKNAVYDKIETISAGASGWTDGTNVIYATTTTDFIGIGTTIPTTSLDIKQSNAKIRINNAGTGANVFTTFGDSGANDVLEFGLEAAGDFRVSNTGNHDMWFGTNDTERVRIRAAGTVIFAPTDTPATCNGGNEGGIYYDNSLNEFCDCDGSSWAQIDGGGAC